MKFCWIFLCLTIFVVSSSDADDSPGFFLKTKSSKNIPRLGKRVFIKPGGKNIPRLGRRGSASLSNDNSDKFSHVQPFSHSFILDIFSSDFEGDVKFLSWDDFDNALENDAALKEKLTKIAHDKEFHELKALAGNDDEVMVVPYGGNSRNVNENDFYHYYVKRGERELGERELFGH